jgi:hypothetical protein
MWQAGWWEEASERTGIDCSDEVQAGRVAYAQRQAALRRNMHDNCRKKWRHIDEFIQTGDLKTLEEEEDASIDEGDDELAEFV